ncbi:hypothetical protein [Aliikangiella coralliicola]|uniref:Uncharacterized protein n=1 Tax=Aliikangiella coralliicola TaxID=2592383 RepID=A0A545UJ82_9GAMM|nr:hypothetical protein [Aliikangiella coralliicola]TQV89521.1 hypothetical protein FLL46_01160 [Aliikangiella coralliicola]
MKENDVLVYVAGKDEAGIRIHVQVGKEERVNTLIFSDYNHVYEESFLQWLKTKTHLPISALNFTLCGRLEKEFQLFSELYSAGAKVSLVA